MDRGGRVTSLGGVNFRYFGVDNRLQAIVEGTNEKRFNYDPWLRSALASATTWVPTSIVRAPMHTSIMRPKTISRRLTQVVSLSHKKAPHYENDSGSMQVFIYDGLDQPLWQLDLQDEFTAYYELDTLGNVRRLHLRKSRLSQGQSWCPTPSARHRRIRLLSFRQAASSQRTRRHCGPSV